MKKLLLILCLAGSSIISGYSQCVQTCSNYALMAITYSLFPTSGTDAIPMFSPNSDDGYSPAIPLGFNFDFYCQTTNQVIISSNGFLVFDVFQSLNPTTSQTAPQIPNGGTPNAYAAFNFNDLDPGVGGTVTYTTIGTSPNRMFILTYSNVPMWSVSSALNSGQIVLFETSNIIEIHTATVIAGTYPGTQGIENNSGSAGVGVPGRVQTTWSGSNSGYRFLPVTPAPPTSIVGTTSSCQGASNSYTASTLSGATSYSWITPGGWVGTSSTTVLNTTVSSSGLLSVTATYTCGTSAPFGISVTVIPAPNVGFASVTPNIFCSGVTITITPSGALTYTVMPGNMSGSGPFNDMPMVNTTYTITGTNASGCVSQNVSSYNVTVKETPTVTVNSGAICLGNSFTITPSGAGTYTYSSIFGVVTPPAGVNNFSVTGTSTNGCVSNVAVSTVTVHQLPNISIVASRATICNKESTTLTAGGALSYVWSTASTLTAITITPQVNNSYFVNGTDANGCVNTQTFSVKVNACLGVSENSSGLDINVYPNPSTGVFNLTLSQNMKITVFNLLGQELFSADLTEGTQQINLSAQPAGKYFITLSSGNSRKNMVLIRE